MLIPEESEYFQLLVSILFAVAVHSLVLFNFVCVDFILPLRRTVNQ